MADLLEDIKASNIFLTVKNWELKYTMRSPDNPKDFGYLNESRKKAKLAKKCAVVDGCYRMFKSIHVSMYIGPITKSR